MLKNNTPAFAANAPTDPTGAAERSAYQGRHAAHGQPHGRHRHVAKRPEQQRARARQLGLRQDAQPPEAEPAAGQGSYIVLDSKGVLYREMAPYLRKQGYQVDQLDFVGMNGALGYNLARRTSDAKNGHPRRAGHHRHRLRALPARRPRERPVVGRLPPRTDHYIAHR